MALSLRVCDVDTSGPRPVYVESTDEELIEVGGRWDRRRKRWAGPAQVVQPVRVPRGSDQEQPARWLAEWLRRAARGKGDHWKEKTTIPGRISVEFRRVWTLMLVGGRRGGKSHLAVITLVAMALLSPRAELWAISPTQDETDELDRAARSILPLRWFTEHAGRTNKTMTFRFANGSRLKFISGHKPRGLKRGRVDIALYNEGQNMTRAGWTQLRGAIADDAGLVVIACNPPDAEIGRWIEALYEQTRAKTVAAESFHLAGKNNPFVSAESLEDMRREVDDVTARKEIDGEMGVPIGDVVFHAWSDSETVREVPAEFVDVTYDVTRKHFGRPFGYVVGMDFQKTPHMCAVFYRFFRDPTDETGDVIAWAVDEVVVDNADESDLVDGMEALERWSVTGRVTGEHYRGWIEPTDSPTTPVHCCIVADASGFFQSGDHQKGQRSDKRIAARRWTFAYKPQKDSDRNPIVSERVKATNTRLKLAGPNGRRRMFSCKHNILFNRAMREWQNLKSTGTPDKNAEPAHVCDAGTYPIYRIFGAPKVKGTAAYKGAGKRTRADEIDPVRAFLKPPSERSPDRPDGRRSRADEIKGW